MYTIYNVTEFAVVGLLEHRSASQIPKLLLTVTTEIHEYRINRAHKSCTVNRQIRFGYSKL